MHQRITSYELILNNISYIGILSFVILYVYGTSLYPGGSQLDINSEGFDWLNNYWCNLMNEKGINGQNNPARIFSIVAMILVCNSLAIFFYQFSKFFAQRKIWKLSISFGGVLSMLFASLIFTEYHDLFTIISSIIGFFALFGITIEMYYGNFSFYKKLGVICIFLLFLNNMIYYSHVWIEILPFLQKITFLIVILWVSGLNYELRKRIQLSQI